MTPNAVIQTSPPLVLGVPCVIPHNSHLSSVLTTLVVCFLQPLPVPCWRSVEGWGKWSRKGLGCRVGEATSFRLHRSLLIRSCATCSPWAGDSTEEPTPVFPRGHWT